MFPIFDEKSDSDLTVISSAGSWLEDCGGLILPLAYLSRCSSSSYFFLSSASYYSIFSILNWPFPKVVVSGSCSYILLGSARHSLST